MDDDKDYIERLEKVELAITTLQGHFDSFLLLTQRYDKELEAVSAVKLDLQRLRVKLETDFSALDLQAQRNDLRQQEKNEKFHVQHRQGDAQMDNLQLLLDRMDARASLSQNSIEALKAQQIHQKNKINEIASAHDDLSGCYLDLSIDHKMSAKDLGEKLELLMTSVSSREVEVDGRFFCVESVAKKNCEDIANLLEDWEFHKFDYDSLKQGSRSDHNKFVEFVINHSTEMENSMYASIEKKISVAIEKISSENKAMAQSSQMELGNALLRFGNLEKQLANLEKRVHKAELVNQRQTLDSEANAL